MDIEIPTAVTVADTDAADALVAAGWEVYPPGYVPPDPVPPDPGPPDAHDTPATGWPTNSVWAQGGRLVAADDFVGPTLSPLWASGQRWQGYDGAPPGYCKQAESQWNVPGVYGPEMLTFPGDGKGLRVGMEYRPDNPVKGPPGNDPCYYVCGSICSTPNGLDGVSGVGCAPVGFAWRAGAVAVIIEWRASMPTRGPLGWSWQGGWAITAGPGADNWCTEFDLTESVGAQPNRPILTTSHWKNGQSSQGPWGKQPQPGETHTYTTHLYQDLEVWQFCDGENRANNPAVPWNNGLWLSFIHQSGLAGRPRDHVADWTSDYQRIEYFRLWTPMSVPAGTGIHGGGIHTASGARAGSYAAEPPQTRRRDDNPSGRWGPR